MKIYGPYKGKDGRFRIIKYINGNKITQSYARYLMEEKLGRVLTKNETVDHIDGNPKNNNLNNLQILGHKDHDTKTRNQRGTWARKNKYKCPICNKEFEKLDRHVKYNQGTLKRVGPFCSKHCVGIYGTRIQAKLKHKKGV